MNKIGAEFFTISLALNGLQMRVAQQIVDYSKELSNEVDTITSELISNFDLESEVKREFEIQYKKAVHDKVEQLIRINSNIITIEAKTILEYRLEKRIQP